jgi:Uma2 family endonuclease
MFPAPAKRMTEDEYLAYDLAHEHKAEFVNGEAVDMSGVSPEHDAVVINLTLALGNRIRGGPCRVRGADLRVRLDETGMYAYPDLTLVCGKAQFADTKPPSLLNPKVIVEVLSESTAAYDLGAKAAHYRHRASVDTLVFVDSRRRMVQLQTRNADGTWTLSERTDGELPLATLGFSVPLAEIYEGVPG